MKRITALARFFTNQLDGLSLGIACIKDETLACIVVIIFRVGNCRDFFMAGAIVLANAKSAANSSQQSSNAFCPLHR